MKVPVSKQMVGKLKEKTILPQFEG